MDLELGDADFPATLADELPLRAFSIALGNKRAERAAWLEIEGKACGKRLAAKSFGFQIHGGT
jgi:hypothetical protein